MGDVDPALGDGDDQPAAAVAEVGDDHDRLLGLGGALGEDVHAGDAQVAAALLDLGHDVGRPHEDDVEPGVPGDRRLVLAVAGAADLVAGRLEDLDDPVVEVPLRGEGQADRVDRRGSAIIGDVPRPRRGPGGPGAAVDLGRRSGPPVSWSDQRAGVFERPDDDDPGRGRATRPSVDRLVGRAARSPGSRGRPCVRSVRGEADRVGVRLGAGGDDQEAAADARRGPRPWASSTCSSRSRPKANPTPRSSRSLPSTRARPS